MDWTGIFPAITTKFTEEGKLDLVTFGANIEKQIQAGVNGIVLGGTLGESSVLEDSEKKELMQVATEICNGRVPVILNIGESKTSKAIEASQLAFDNGAEGLMLLPPLRYKPDDREMIEFFRVISESTPLPIMIYNNPVDYGNLVRLDHFNELTRYENIQAVKESTRDTGNVTKMLNQFGERFMILCGVDTLALESLLLGAHGWVSGLVCAFPTETVKLFDLVKEGQIEKAIELNRWFYPLLELDIHPKLVQYIKLAESLTGMGTEYVRPPRLVLEGEERERILSIIQQQLLHRPK
jgi:1-pyrroline-4-hydroxy-2-carboxylate deaminase